MYRESPKGITKEIFQFVDIFCAHSANLKQSRKHNHQIFTKPVKVSLVIPCILNFEADTYQQFA